MTARQKDAGPDGVLVVDKPSGPTSFDVVASARRAYRTRKVGHCGTLDPFASGVLVLVFGEAAKLSSHLTRADKAYRATLRFGYGTNTLDRSGERQEERELHAGWSNSVDWEAVLQVERQRTTQIPPQFSAIKLEGVRAYKSARRGEQVELEARPVRVNQLTYVQHDDSELVVDLIVSKGYYVRSLARDLCLQLGVPGHLGELRRTRSGCFELNEACSWPPTPVPPALLSVRDASIRALPTTSLTAEGEDRARKGQKLWGDHFTTAMVLEPSVWLSAAGDPIALGEAFEPPPRSDGMLFPGPSFRVIRGFKAKP